MIDIYNHFLTKGSEWKILATIHDEVLLEVPETITPEEVVEIENIMKTCVTLAVPMKVDTEVMIRWGDGCSFFQWSNCGCGREAWN